MIFVGNILTEEGREKLTRSSEGIKVPFETMEIGFDRDKCEHIGELLEGYIITLLEKYPEENNIGNPIIEKIKSYVQANIQYDLSLTDIAGLYFYSEVYLGRLFKKETGSSFKEYVNSERIKLAAKYLTEGKNVIEAANMAGYNSVSYFNRVFKAQTGKTPSEYKSAKANS